MTDPNPLRHTVYGLLAMHTSDLTKADEVVRFIEENYDPKPTNPPEEASRG